MRTRREGFEERFNSAVCDALNAVAERGADMYQEALSAKTHPEFPAGRLDGDPFPPPHSSPGEYPDRETGQGHDSVDFAVDCVALVSRFGLRGDGPSYGITHSQPGGLHLNYSESKKDSPNRRKDFTDIVYENLGELAQVFEISFNQSF